MKHLLTIAGSDSSGGAGIQADLKTFAAHGTFGMSVITAVTAQNTQGVTMVQDIDAGVIEAQIDAVFDDIRVDAVKIGMVSRPEIIKTIADRLRYYKPQILVLDPVMISKSGYPLLAPEACATLVQELLPLATLVTPNLPEAEVISGMKVTMKEEMRPVAERILELGAKAVLVKGGHLMTCCLMAVQNAGLWEIASTQKIRMVPAAHYPVRWRQTLPRVGAWRMPLRLRRLM